MEIIPFVFPVSPMCHTGCCSGHMHLDIPLSCLIVDSPISHAGINLCPSLFSRLFVCPSPEDIVIHNVSMALRIVPKPFRNWRLRSQTSRAGCLTVCELGAPRYEDRYAFVEREEEECGTGRDTEDLIDDVEREDENEIEYFQHRKEGLLTSYVDDDDDDDESSYTSLYDAGHGTVNDDLPGWEYATPPSTPNPLPNFPWRSRSMISEYADSQAQSLDEQLEPEDFVPDALWMAREDERVEIARQKSLERRTFTPARRPSEYELFERLREKSYKRRGVMSTTDMFWKLRERSLKRRGVRLKRKSGMKRVIGGVEWGWWKLKGSVQNI